MISSLTPCGDVGRVDEGPADLDEAIELSVGALLVGLVAEGHRAQRKRRHRAPAAAQAPVPFHASSSLVHPAVRPY